MPSPTVVFDIETSGLPLETQLSTFEPEFQSDSRLKDPAKVTADIEEKRAKWADSAALHAERARVLVIGYISEGQHAVLEGDEKVMLAQFWRNWSGCTSSYVGHNIKGFDVPFMIRRSYILGVLVPLDLFDGRYLSRRFMDTMELWAAGEWGAKVSLDTLARAFGVGKKSGSGKDFAALYHSDKAKALEYVKNDLSLTLGVAKKMGVA